MFSASRNEGSNTWMASIIRLGETSTISFWVIRVVLPVKLSLRTCA